MPREYSQKFSDFVTQLKQTAKHIMGFIQPLKTHEYLNHLPGNHEGITVYCVHGTADRASSFKNIAENLLPNLPANVSSIVLVEFEGRAQGKSIQDFSNQLYNKIESDGAKNVVLMGHSRGGLIAAQCAVDILERRSKEKLNGVVDLPEMNAEKKHDVNVRGVITICSPFGGSDLAIAPLSLVSQSVDEMQHGSPYLKELEKSVRQSAEGNHAIPYQFFRADQDIIVKEKDAVVAGVGEVKTLQGHNHLSIMQDSNTATEIGKVLDKISLNQEKISELEQSSVQSTRPHY